MKRIIFGLLTLLVLTHTVAKEGSEINTGKLVPDVLGAVLNNPTGNFLNWKLTGMCFWLHWSIFGPYYTQTWRVNEFLPDTIITVYNREGEDPFLFSNKILDPILKAMGDQIAKTTVGMKPIAGSDSAASHNDGMLQYKEVDVLGDPMASVVDNLIPNMMIPTVSTPYVPYYSSLLDSVLWRDPKVDLLTHPQDLLTSIGTTDQWGSLYPRNGYVDQAGDFKAAAVDALRATDIATITGVSHITNSLPTGSCGDQCTIEPNSESDVNDFSKVKYQEIYPVESNTAQQTFGVEDPIVGTYGQDQFDKGNGNYAWLMWRHYSGCIQDGGQLIYVIKF